MSSNKSLTKKSSADDYFMSMVDNKNSQLILDMIKSILQKSYLDLSYSCSFWKIEEIFVITNEKLEMNYREKSEELKAAHETLYPTTLFTCYRTQNCLKDIAVHGLRTKPKSFNILGDNSKGVTLCQHADIQLKAAEVRPARCFLFLFACMSSRIARIDCCDQGKNSRCPVSSYDCHISSVRPSLTDNLLTQAVRAQVYFYDVNENDTYYSHPRQCLPLACVVYTPSESGEKSASVKIKHIEVGQPKTPEEAVVDLTGPDETIPLLSEAKGTILYNRLRRHFRKATSAEEIYCLSNYFPKPGSDSSLSVAASSLSELGASWHRIPKSSLQPMMPDSVAAVAITIAGTVQERVTVVTCHANPVYSLKEKMSQFCVNKNQTSLSSVPSVTLPNAGARTVGIAMAANAAPHLPSVGGTTLSPNAVPTWARGPTVTVNTVSWPMFSPNGQIATVSNALPMPGSTSARASVTSRLWTPKVVDTAVATSAEVFPAYLRNTNARDTTVGQVHLQQGPRMVRYLPRILRPVTRLSGIRLLSNSNAASAAVASPVVSGRVMTCAVPTFLGSNVVPLVTEPQWQSILPQSPLHPLYADCSQLNLLAQPASHDPQAELMKTAAASVVSLAGTSANAAGTVRLISRSPFLFRAPSSVAHLTVNRSTEQQIGSLADAPEQNLFFKGNEVEEITIEDEGMIISGVRPYVIMPDGTCDEGEEQTGTPADMTVQGSTETKPIDCNRVSDCGKGILKKEEKNWVKNQKNHTIILDADLPLNEVVANSELVDQEVDEDGDLLDKQLRISDVVSLQPNCDLNESAVVHHRLLGELWAENAGQLDIVRPVENSVSSASRKVISLASDAVTNPPQVSTESISLESTEVLPPEPETSIHASFSEAPVLCSVADSLMHPTTVTSLQDDARTLKEKTAEKELTASADDTSIVEHGSQKWHKVSVSKPEKQKHPSLSFGKLPKSRNHQQRRHKARTRVRQPVSEQNSVGLHVSKQNSVCLPVSEQNCKAPEKTSSKQEQRIPVFTVGADGTVSIRLDTETEASEDMLNARQCDARIELLKDVYEKDSLMKALAEVLGNICVTDMRNSSKEIVYGSQNKKAEKITSGSLNKQRNNVDGVERRTGLKKDSAVSHKSAKPDSDNNASDTNLCIEDVCSIDTEKFDEIIKSSGMEKHPKDPLQGKGVTSENDGERIGRLNDAVAHTSRENDVESMNVSDIEENDVENAETIQHVEAETEKLSLSTLNTKQGFQHQFDFSDMGCSSDVSSATLKHLVSGNEHGAQFANKNLSETSIVCEELPLGSKSKSDSSKTPHLDSTDGLETSRINKEMPFESEILGLNEEISLKLSHNLRTDEDEPLRSRSEAEPATLNKELPMGSAVESEIPGLQAKGPLNSVNKSQPSRLGKQVLLNSELEHSGINERQLLDISNESETCDNSEKQLLGFSSDSENRTTNKEPLANESDILGISQESPLDSANKSDFCRTCEEQHLHMSNESETCVIHEEKHLYSLNESESCRESNEQPLHLAIEPQNSRIREEQLLNLASESETCREHEEQQPLGLANESETCRINEQQPVGLASESETCRINEQQPVGLASVSETCRINEQQPVGLASESETCRINEQQPVGLASESETCRINEQQPEGLASESETCRINEQQPVGFASESETCRINEQQPEGFASESETCRINEQQPEGLASESETCRINEQQPEGLASESETCRINEQQPEGLASESETCRINEQQPEGLASESETCRINEQQPEGFASESETCRINEEQLLDLANEPGICRINGEQQLHLADDSETWKILGDQLADSANKLETYRIHNDQPLRSENESETYTINEELLHNLASDSKTCGIDEPKHLDLANESKLLGISKEQVLNSEDESAITRTFLESPLNLEVELGNSREDESAITRTFQESPLNLEVELGDSRVNEKSQLAKAVNSLNSNTEKCETIVFCSLKPVSPAYISEAISPISPAYVTEAISPAYVTEAISPAYVTEPISPAYVTEPISPAYVTEPISPAACDEEPVFPTNTFRPLREDVAPRSPTDDDPAAQDVFDSEHGYLLEPVRKSLEPDFETSSQRSYAKETKAAKRTKKKLSLEEYKQNKLKGPVTGDSMNKLSALETQVQNLNLNLSSLHLDKHALNQEQFLGVEGSCRSDFVTFTMTGTERRPEDLLKNRNPTTNVNLRLSNEVTGSAEPDVIRSVSLRDPRLRHRGNAFRSTEAEKKNTPSETEGKKDFDQARAQMIAQKQQFVAFSEDVMHVKNQQQLVTHLETEEEGRSSQNMDELLNNAAVVAGMNGKERERKDKQEIELMGGDREQENAGGGGCQVTDQLNRDEEIQEIGSDGKEPGEIEEENCTSATQENVEHVVSEPPVIEVLDDWDEYGDLVIVGNGLDVLSDDDKESGEVTSESSDEFGDLAVNDGADGRGNYDFNLQLRQLVDEEPDQERVWHLLDNALTVRAKCESEDQAQAKVKHQLKAGDRQVQKKSPVVIKLKSEAAKHLAQGKKAPPQDVYQESSDTGLKGNNEGSVVTEKSRPHYSHYRKHKSASKKDRRSHRRKNAAGDHDFSSAEHLNISDERHENHRTSEDQSLSYRWNIPRGDVTNLSPEDKGCTPIDIEIIKVLRNVDEISAGRSVFGSADSFVTLLMKEFQHLPEESRQHYSECIRQTLQVDEEFVTSEHVYGSMAELLTAEQRQHIQQTNISPVVARELHLEDILRKVKLELAEIPSESSCDQNHRNLLILTKEMLYDQMNDLKCYHKSRSVFVLPDELRLPREYGKYISVDGSLLFVSKCMLSVKKCCKLYCYRTEIEEMEEELNDSLCNARRSTEEICRKLSVLYLMRRHCLQEIGCSADQLHGLKKKFSKNLSWFRRMRDILQSKDCSRDGQERALVSSLNQRIKKLREYVKVITRLKNVDGIWYPNCSDRTEH